MVLSEIQCFAFIFVNMCLYFEPSDLRSNGHCASCVYFSFCAVSFKPFDLNLAAVMNCFMIKSGPLDSSDGPDLICLSQTHDPYF